MGKRLAGIHAFRFAQLYRLENTGVLHARKVVEDLRLLADRRVCRDRAAGNRNRSGRPQFLRIYKLQQSAIQPQQRDFGLLNLENLCQNAAYLPGRHILIQEVLQRRHVGNPSRRLGRIRKLGAHMGSCLVPVTKELPRSLSTRRNTPKSLSHSVDKLRVINQNDAFRHTARCQFSSPVPLFRPQRLTVSVTNRQRRPSL